MPSCLESRSYQIGSSSRRYTKTVSPSPTPTIHLAPLGLIPHFEIIVPFSFERMLALRLDSLHHRRPILRHERPGCRRGIAFPLPLGSVALEPFPPCRIVLVRRHGEWLRRTPDEQLDRGVFGCRFRSTIRNLVSVPPALFPILCRMPDFGGCQPEVCSTALHHCMHDGHLDYSRIITRGTDEIADDDRSWKDPL